MILKDNQPRHTAASIVEKRTCWNHPYICTQSSATSVHMLACINSDQDIITSLDNGTRENLKTIRNDAKELMPDLSISYSGNAGF